MKGIIFSTILFISFLWPSFLMADESLDPCHYSTEGTDFWIGFMQNRSTHPLHYLEITVTSRFGADFTVTYGPDEIAIGTYTVLPNESKIIPIDYLLLESIGSEIREGKGIHLVSTNPVNVYALNYRTQSSDVAVIYPTESLGKEYFAMCYTPRPTSNNESNSEFIIVASEDNTTVNVTPSVNTDQGKPANVPFIVQLNKGQAYQVQSMNNVVAGQGDLSGSFVSANKPIAFFSGSKATPIPNSGYTNFSYDHLFEQMPPTSTWGKEFYVVPLKQKVKDTYRVLAAEDGTTVTIEGLNRTITINKGKFFEFELTSTQACRIISSKRVMLAQYCRSQRADGNTGVGDPFMIILSPVVQKVSDVTFVAYKSPKVENIFYINIITLTSEVGNILLDGSGISSNFNAFPNSKYSYAQVATNAGPHRLHNPNDDGGFLAYMYGFGNFGDTESYGYGVGYNLDIQLDIEGDIKDDTLVICKGESYELDAGNYFNSYEWSPSDESTYSIKVSKEGWYTVTASTILGCKKSDKVYVKVNNPQIDLGEDTGSCYPGEIVLDAGPGFESYLWQDGSTNRTFIVEETGDYTVTGINKSGCKATDIVSVTVFDPAFSQNYEVASDVHPDISFFNETELAVSYFWDFGDGETSTDENPVHHYKAIGEYKVVLQQHPILDVLVLPVRR